MGVRRGWLLFVVIGLLLAGCGGEGGGDPGVAEPTVESTSVAWPSRPRDVPIDGIDPCTLLTPQQRAELGLDRPPLNVPGATALYGPNNAFCVINGFEQRSVTVAVMLVTTVGIERWTEGQLDADVRRILVEDFPALVAVPRRYTDYCTVVVDISPGQLIDVQVASGGRHRRIPQPQLCRDAEQVAGYVVTNLLSR